MNYRKQLEAEIINLYGQIAETKDIIKTKEAYLNELNNCLPVTIKIADEILAFQNKPFSSSLNFHIALNTLIEKNIKELLYTKKVEDLIND